MRNETFKTRSTKVTGKIPWPVRVLSQKMSSSLIHTKNTSQLKTRVPLCLPDIDITFFCVNLVIKAAPCRSTSSQCSPVDAQRHSQRGSMKDKILVQKTPKSNVTSLSMLHLAYPSPVSVLLQTHKYTVREGHDMLARKTHEPDVNCTSKAALGTSISS